MTVFSVSIQMMNGIGDEGGRGKGGKENVAQERGGQKQQPSTSPTEGERLIIQGNSRERLSQR